MSLPRFSLRHPQIVIAFTTVAVVTGIMAFSTVPRRSDPEFTLPEIRITTVWPGVETERIERLVTAPIERTVSELDDIRYVTSTTTPGLSVIGVRALDEVPASGLPQLWDRVRGQVRNLQSTLPQGVQAPVVDSEFGDTAVLQVAVFAKAGLGETESKGYSHRELRDYAELIRSRVELDPGVASARLYGVRQEVIFIEASSDTWSAIDLTIDDLRAALATRNIHLTGGSFETGDARVSVRATGELQDPADIERLVVGRSENGAPILLRDTGLTVRRGYADPPRAIVRYGAAEASTDAIILSVIMTDDAQATALAPRLLATIDAMQTTERLIPPDIGVQTVFDEASFVDRKISSFLSSLVQAIALVVLVALLLAGIRSASVMAAAIPFVMLMSFGLASKLGVVLEQMAIASLIISLGLMVDNAVVVSDNSRRFMNKGLPRKEAVAKGVKEILLPTLMGTLTTVFVFLPMLFALKGAKAEYVFSIPVVVGITLLTSWLVGMTLTTLMASVIIRPVPEGASSSPLAWIGRRLGGIARRCGIPTRSLSDIYGALVAVALRRRWIVLGSSLLLFVGATRLPIGSQFFPNDLRDQFYVDVWLPQGSSLAATDRVTRQVEDLLREFSRGFDSQEPAIGSIYSSVGGSGPRFALGVAPTAPTPNFAQIIVTTSDPRLTATLVEEFREVAEARVAGARVIPCRFILGPPVTTPIGLRLSSVGLDDPGFADIDELRGQADRFLVVLRETPGTWNHHTSWGEVAMEIKVDIDTEQAAVAGVTSEAVASTLRAYLSGQTLTLFRDGELEIPLMFRLPESERTLDLSPQRLFVEGFAGKVPLDSVAEVSVRPATTRIERRDNQRMIEVRARNHEGFLANECLAAAEPRVQALRASLPPGMSLEYGGEIEEAQNAQIDFAVAFGVGFLLLLLVLIVQYSSLVKSIVILATLPMGAIGALGGLYFAGEPLGFMQMLGLVALAGMVVNSAILYVEFADALIRQKLEEQRATELTGDETSSGLSRGALRQCLAEAGKIRMLPIMLTSLTTIGGFVPLLYGGPLWRGLAAAMIGGLAVATVLTLVVLPVIYGTLVEVFGFRPVRTEEVE